MTPPIQLQRLPKRKTNKPATVRALFWVIAIPCFAIFCAGVIAKCTPTPVFPL
jgi:hypothetical protein